MTFDYIPKGVCARKFTIQVEDGVIQSVKAEGGCNGNLQGVAALLRGMTPEEAQQEAGRCLRCDHFGYGIFKGGRNTEW